MFLWKWNITMMMKTFEITLTDPVTEHEFAFWEGQVCRDGWETAATPNGRMIMLDCDCSIEELCKFLGKTGFADDVGLIREIIEYIPDREMIVVEFE